MALNSDYLMRAAERITGLYSDIETEIIADICRRLAALGEFTPTSAWELKKLDELTGISNEAKQRITEFLNISAGELEQMFVDGAEYSMVYDNDIYAQAYAEGIISKPPVSVIRSPAQMQVLESGLVQTMGELRNITRTTAREATGIFTSALDDIWLQVASGAFTEDVAIRNAVKRLAEKGIHTIEYSKRNDRAEVAIRRALTTGLNQTVSKIQLAAADDMGCDLVEVSAHYGARPSHAEWQGKIYSLKGVQGEYADFYDATGYGTGEGLCGWNCGHSFYIFFEGLSKPNRTIEELKAMENATVTYNGEEISLYSATQLQRKYERNIRTWKREAVALEAAGLDNRAELLKVTGWQSKLNDLLEQTGLRPQYARSQVDGYGRSMARRAKNVAKIVAQNEKIEYNKQESVRLLISQDITRKDINVGNQLKHIKDSSGYMEGRSYIFGDKDTAQALINKHSGTGEIKLDSKGNWTNKEFITVDFDIGVYVNPYRNSKSSTNRFSIHYGKKGTHIVPAERKESKQ